MELKRKAFDWCVCWEKCVVFVGGVYCFWGGVNGFVDSMIL